MRFRSAFGSLATVESEEGSWSFKRVGFWRTAVTVRAAGSEQDLGRFLNNTWSAGGTLELPDGRRYRANTHFWGSSYEFQDETGIALVSYRRISGLLHLSAFMEISENGARLPELPWLVSLGWYLAVKMHDDAAMAAAAAG
jgi:hypothetical protein